MIKICVEIDECELSSDKGFKFFPRFSLPKEQTSPVTKTPQFARHLHNVKRTLIVAEALTATQFEVVTIEPKDRKGNAAKLDGVPDWATDNSDILALEPAPDGLSCKVTAVGMLGSANVQVTGDADLGSGVAPIIGTLQFDVSGGVATVINITPGTPTEQQP